MDLKAFLKSKQISTSSIAAICDRCSLADYGRDWLIVATRIHNGSGIQVSIYGLQTGVLIDSWRGELSPYFQKKFNNYWKI